MEPTLSRFSPRILFVIQDKRGKTRVIFDVVLHTMALFFLILATGFVAGKLNIIKKDFLPEFAGLITKILLPCLIFYATTSGCTRQAIFDNLAMIGLAAAFYVTIAFITFLLMKLLRLPAGKGRIFMMCFVFGNTGFVGIPLLSAVFPNTGLLYMSLFSLVDTPIFWTFGIWLATPKEHRKKHFENTQIEGGSVHSLRHMIVNVGKSLLTPNIVAMVLAFIFVLAELPLPGLINDAFATISAATSAMCMMYLGALLCFSNFLDAIKCKEVYVGVAVKMVVLPCAIALLVQQLPIPAEMATAITLIAALPTMTIVPMIAAQRGPYGDYAAGVTVTTLVFSLVTIPLVAFLVL